MDQPFTIENMQLTKSLKKRRKIIKDIYKAEIEKMFGPAY